MNVVGSREQPAKPGSAVCPCSVLWLLRWALGCCLHLWPQGKQSNEYKNAPRVTKVSVRPSSESISHHLWSVREAFLPAGFCHLISQWHSVSRGCFQSPGTFVLKDKGHVSSIKRYLWHPDWFWFILKPAPFLFHCTFLLENFQPVKMNNEFVWVTRTVKIGFRIDPHLANFTQSRVI